MNFKIPYEDAKKILSVFYQSPYQVSAPFVAILDGMKNDEDNTLRHCIEAEIEATKKEAELPKEE
jgi:hypothetical protein